MAHNKGVRAAARTPKVQTPGAIPSSRSLFGTDGIRGVANQYPMTPEVALALGRAVATTLANGQQPIVVVGKDTRLSGYLFENAVTAGLLAGGATVYLVGPLPTPAVAHITRSFAADAGIMITASHNPADHNGIKIFDRDGRKLPDTQEALIEQQMRSTIGANGRTDTNGRIGKAKRIEDARGRYIEFAKATIGNRSLAGLRIVLDCANGAAYSITPMILRELGAEVIVLNDQPDGLNINRNCGAVHPEIVASAVREHKAHIGISLDGDADRVILVDEKGVILTGDHILAIMAPRLAAAGTLAHTTVVGTEYTNQGLDAALAPHGIRVVRVGNGDRYIIEELRRGGYTLGGEQSGHIIFAQHATTGDGTISALQVLAVMQATRQPLSRLAAVFTAWPQRTESFMVKEKIPIERLPRSSAAIAAAKATLGSNGRVLVRYSGTEQKIRVMVEAKQSRIVDEQLRAICAALRKEVGA